MKIDRIKYTKEFNYHGFSEWVGVEGSIDPEETPMEALKQAKATAVEFFNQSIAESKNIPVVDVKDKAIEPDAEFEKIKQTLFSIEFREDAQDFLNTTAYSYTIEAKQIVNLKPLKNK